MLHDGKIIIRLTFNCQFNRFDIFRYVNFIKS